MSRDALGQRFCDACGRLIAKATRVDGGREFCATCYKREFVVATCTTCERPSRYHHRHEVPPPCPFCALRTRTCARCERPVPRAALMLPDDRAVCASCAPYYRQAAPCTSCGQLSSRLARMPRYGVNEPICERCQTKLTHRTCVVCHRYRRVLGHDAAGKPHCKACDPTNLQVHACPTCGTIQPGSGKGQCRPCQNRARVTTTATLTVTALQREWCRWLVQEFGSWLTKRLAGSPKVLGQFPAHQPFFERLDTGFEYLSDLTPTSLVELFSVRELRLHVLPVRFLQERLGLELSQQAKDDRVERGRIQDIVNGAHRESWGPLLAGYATWLTANGMAKRTARLYLVAAEAFCRTQALVSISPWKPEELTAFLTRHGSARASLYRFVTYCHRSLGWSVTMPPARALRPGNLRRPRTVPRLARLLSRIQKVGIDQARTRDLASTLAVALGYSVSAMAQGEWRIVVHDEVTSLVHDDETLTLPLPLVPIASAWVRRRSATALAPTAAP